MIRKLKVILLAALAVSALGWVSGPGAHAGEVHSPRGASGRKDYTHARKDGTGKTAHLVFDIFNAATTASVSFTCNEVLGDGHAVGPEPTSLTITTPLVTGECQIAGQKLVTAHPGLCNLTFLPSGVVEIVNDGATTECKHGQKPILTTTGPFNCTVEVGAQQLKGLVKYHNLKGATRNSRSQCQGETITVE